MWSCGKIWDVVHAIGWDEMPSDRYVVNIPKPLLLVLYFDNMMSLVFDR